MDKVYYYAAAFRWPIACPLSSPHMLEYRKQTKDFVEKIALK